MECFLFSSTQVAHLFAKHPLFPKPVRTTPEQLSNKTPKNFEKIVKPIQTYSNAVKRVQNRSKSVKFKQSLVSFGQLPVSRCLIHIIVMSTSCLRYSCGTHEEPIRINFIYEKQKRLQSQSIINAYEIGIAVMLFSF